MKLYAVAAADEEKINQISDKVKHGNYQHDCAFYLEVMGLSATETVFIIMKAFGETNDQAAKTASSLRACVANSTRCIVDTDWVEQQLISFQAKFDATRSAISEPGNVIATLTCLQAIVRPLEPGETRKSLAKSALKGIAKRDYFGCEAALKSYVAEVAEGRL